jgi:hypothetical protein
MELGTRLHDPPELRGVSCPPILQQVTIGRGKRIGRLVSRFVPKTEDKSRISQASTVPLP